ncbi:MAG: beta-lactamase family protein [Flavobacteriales bacterium]|nr:beta-lactamase family protein [Flavobacteriales bacterium]
MKFTILLASIAVFSLSCNTSLYKSIRYNKPDIDDHKILTQIPIKKDQEAFVFHRAEKEVALPRPKEWAVPRKYKKIKKIERRDPGFDDFMEETKTVSLLVIRNDTILFEKYYNGYSEQTPVQNFSVTKPITTSLIHFAIEDGFIQSIDQKVKDFIPEYEGRKEGEITLAQLMNMTAGYKSDYANPFKVSLMYYAKKRSNYITKYRAKENPGQKFRYSSYSTSLLGYCLEKAIQKPASKYLEEKIWTRIGTEFPAAMVAHQDSGEMHFCGLVAQARDLAKIGRLFINNGKWQGEQIVGEEWVEGIKNRDTLNGNWWGYNKGWWLDTYRSLTQDQICSKVWNTDHKLENFQCRDFIAAGFNGQELYMDPQNNVIIVRQGKSISGLSWMKSTSKLGYLMGEMHNNILHLTSVED